MEQFKRAANSCDIPELIRWEAAGVKTEGFRAESLNAWVTNAVNNGDFDAAFHLLGKMKPDEEKQLFLSEKFLLVLLAKNKECYQRLFSDSPKGSTIRQMKEQILYQLFKLGLIRGRFEIAKAIAKDCQSWMSQGYTFKAFTPLQLQRLVELHIRCVDALVVILKCMPAEEASMLVTSDAFLLNLLRNTKKGLGAYELVERSQELGLSEEQKESAIDNLYHLSLKFSFLQVVRMIAEVQYGEVVADRNAIRMAKITSTSSPIAEENETAE